MRTPEGKLKAYARKRLRSIGAYVFSPVQMGYGMPTLDDLCCLNGKFVGIEYKQQGKEPTKRQYQTIEQMKAAGGIAFACDSVEAFEMALRENGLLEPRQVATTEVQQETDHDNGHYDHDSDLDELPGRLR